MSIPPDGRIFRYYLRMNVSTFKQHHVDPEKCIQKAVSLCYVPQNRLLNLERFQYNKSLQDVVVSLSSSKILAHVLSVASRQFMTTCSEIRLCRNKILSVEKVGVLTQMGSLRAVDLSHNWVHDLELIRFLGWGCLSLFNFQRGSKADTLLARNCKAAIDNLFNQRLTISLGAGGSLPISVQLGVAQYKMNQISPTFLIARVVTGLMKRLVQKDGVDGLLDLGSFGDHPEFKNIVVSLGNPCILMTVCQVIHNNDTERFRVNGFILANNQIRNVRPLTLFANVDYALLDLRGNKVS